MKKASLRKFIASECNNKYVSDEELQEELKRIVLGTHWFNRVDGKEVPADGKIVVESYGRKTSFTICDDWTEGE